MNKLIFFLYDTEDYEKEEEVGEYFSSRVPRRSELVTFKEKTYKVVNIEYVFCETQYVKDNLQKIQIFLEVV